MRLSTPPPLNPSSHVHSSQTASAQPEEQTKDSLSAVPAVPAVRTVRTVRTVRAEAESTHTDTTQRSLTTADTPSLSDALDWLLSAHSTTRSLIWYASLAKAAAVVSLCCVGAYRLWRLRRSLFAHKERVQQAVQQAVLNLVQHTTDSARTAKDAITHTAHTTQSTLNAATQKLSSSHNALTQKLSSSHNALTQKLSSSHNALTQKLSSSHNALTQKLSSSHNALTEATKSVGRAVSDTLAHTNDVLKESLKAPHNTVSQAAQRAEERPSQHALTTREKTQAYMSAASSSSHNALSQWRAAQRSLRGHSQRAAQWVASVLKRKK